MNLFDNVIMDAKNVARTKDGYLKAYVRAGRTGIQKYKGYELEKPQLDSVSVYRPPEEVFHRDALSSAAHKPVTLTHPDNPVSAKSWKKDSIGFMGDEVVRDGDHVRVPMMMCDQDAIDAYEKHGVRELSLGYSCDIDWTPGRTPEGETYDAVQRHIRINHLAVVPAARGGKTLRIGDSALKDATKLCPTCHQTVPGEAIRCAYCGHDTSAEMVFDDQQFYDRDVSTEKRKTLAKQGKALPGGGYPIETRGDLKNAIQAFGRAKNPDATKRHIIKRAKELGATSELPEDWKASTKDARASDSKGARKMKTILVDSIPVELEDRDAIIVEKAIKTRDAKAEEAAEKEQAAEKKLRAEDEKMKGMQETCDALKGENAALQKQLADSKLSAAQLDTLVKDRLVVITAARSILGDAYTFEGKELGQIKRDAVALKLSDAEAKEMKDGEIDGAFKAFTKDAGDPSKMFTRNMSDAVRASDQGGGHRPGYAGQQHLYTDARVPADASAAREKAYSDGLASLSSAWKGTGIKAN